MMNLAFWFYLSCDRFSLVRKATQTKMVMSTVKIAGNGTLDVTDEIVWNESKDIQYYVEIHGEDERVQDRRQFLVDQIARNLDWLAENLDRSIRCLWKRPHTLDAEVMSLLSVEGEVDLLQELLLERCDTMPLTHRLKYRRRFTGALAECADAEIQRNEVLRRYLAEPGGIWLRELVDVGESLLGAWMNLDELMACENHSHVMCNQRCLHWIVAAKSLERIAVHAKNIAEEVVFLCEARDIRHNLKR